jgi:hypothetical protein
MTRADGAALLGDFGAATIYRSAAAGEGVGAETALQLQRIEVRALGVLMLELLSIVEGGGGGGCGASRLSLVAESCVNELCNERPLFAAVVEQLQQLRADSL